MNLSLKHAAKLMHGIALRAPMLTQGYLRAFRMAKLLPDGNWKQKILNSLQSVEWPEVRIAPARVEIHPSITAQLVPHVQEFDFAAHVLRRMRYETEVFSWLNGRRYDVVIEIGANVGFHTILFSRLWPESRIFCFEPSRAAYSRLLENLALNKPCNVFPFNCAVSSDGGFVDFYEPDGHLTNGSLDRPFAAIFSDTVRSSKVAAVTGRQIAQLVPPEGRVLLKIDVEGAEPIVVRSLEEFIADRSPDIVIEALLPIIDDLNAIDFLAKSYRFYELEPGGQQERSCFKAGAHRDYALVPRERAHERIACRQPVAGAAS